MSPSHYAPTATRRVQLTKKAIEALTFKGRHGTAHDISWDADVRGFGVRVFPSGAKTFVFRYPTRFGRKRLMTIGKVGELTLDAARQKARALRVEIDNGADPAEVRRTERRAGTFNDLADRYLAEHADKKKKASSALDDRRNLENHIRPRLGAMPIRSINRCDIAALHHRMRATPFAANRIVALLSKIFNLAERWGLIPDGSNPCKHVERFKEPRRERFLSPAELSALGSTLEALRASELEDPNVILAVRLLVLTGCRLSEILTLRWSEVRLDLGQLLLEDSKTGRKAVLLPPQAIQLLEAHRGAEGASNPFVIRGTKPNSHLVNLQKPWRRIRKQAGLDGVRLHDLRHTFASVAASRGLSLPIIGRLLGHRNTATTARYAHLAHDIAQQAAHTTGDALAKSFLPPPA